MEHHLDRLHHVGIRLRETHQRILLPVERLCGLELYGRGDADALRPPQRQDRASRPPVGHHRQQRQIPLSGQLRLVRLHVQAQPSRNRAQHFAHGRQRQDQLLRQRPLPLPRRPVQPWRRGYLQRLLVPYEDRRRSNAVDALLEQHQHGGDRLQIRRLLGAGRFRRAQLQRHPLQRGQQHQPDVRSCQPRRHHVRLFQRHPVRQLADRQRTRRRIRRRTQQELAQEQLLHHHQPGDVRPHTQQGSETQRRLHLPPPRQPRSLPLLSDGQHMERDADRRGRFHQRFDLRLLSGGPLLL